MVFKLSLYHYVVSKEYHYQFTSNTIKNPFDAHMITYIDDDLDIAAMKSATTIFTGEHNFAAFSYPYVQENRMRNIHSCVIETIENSDIYTLKVISSGFMRYQIRLMMGALFEVGKGLLDIQIIKDALQKDSTISFNNKAPASGLTLHRVNY